MRISDWSSDVCSSDLLAITAWRYRRRDAPCRRAMHIMPVDLELDAIAQDLATSCHNADLLLTRYKCRVRGQVAGVSALAGGDFVCFLEIGGRSEEHTSELQSLMRNSYAVFCLKKKK